MSMAAFTSNSSSPSHPRGRQPVGLLPLLPALSLGRPKSRHLPSALALGAGAAGFSRPGGYALDLDSIRRLHGDGHPEGVAVGDTRRGTKPCLHPLLAVLAEAKLVAGFWLRPGNCSCASNVVAFTLHLLGYGGKLHPKRVRSPFYFGIRVESMLIRLADKAAMETERRALLGSNCTVSLPAERCSALQSQVGQPTG